MDCLGAAGVVVDFPPDGARVSLTASKSAVKSIRLSWKGSTTAWKSVLGDHWERSYGDLQWHSPSVNRANPWYLLANTESGTYAIGVLTQPGASADGRAMRVVCN